MGNGATSVLMRELTWPDYVARVGEAILILPVGSTEQHGPHLPLGTDSIQVEHAAILVAEQLGAIVAPTINYGYRSAPKSGGGEIFPGTTSLSGATMIGLVRDILKAFIRHGADRKSTRLNSSHTVISYAVFCLKKKKKKNIIFRLKKQKKKNK